MTQLPRALLLCSLLGLGAVALGGCGGFTPLYATPGVTPKLAAIDVVRPDGRTGFLMGQYLNDQLGRATADAPVYRLLLKTSELRLPRGIRVDNVASRYELDLNTTYTLVEIATRRVVTNGIVKVNITYDSADQPYAGIAAANDGQDRAAQQSADRIRLELASFFASPRTLPPGTPSAAVLASNAAAGQTYSEDSQASVIQSPRERALGQPTPQGGQADIFGRPVQATTPDGQPTTPAFSPSEDPYAIRTIPDSGR